MNCIVLPCRLKRQLKISGRQWIRLSSSLMTNFLKVSYSASALLPLPASAKVQTPCKLIADLYCIACKVSARRFILKKTEKASPVPVQRLLLICL